MSLSASSLASPLVCSFVAWDVQGRPYSEEANRCRDMPEEVDHIVIGSDIGGLYTAGKETMV